MPVNNQSPYPLRKIPGTPKRRGVRVSRRTQGVVAGGLVVVILGTGTFLLPQVVTVAAKQEQATPAPLAVNSTPFPVSVDPAEKEITDNPTADAFYAKQTSAITASAGTVSDILSWIASLIDNTQVYQSLASADGHLITILPGYRKEEVVSELTNALSWNKADQQEFLTASAAQTPGLTDGFFAPGTYVVNSQMTPANVAALMSVAFDKSILVHYSGVTAQQVPLNQALTVASLLEREAAGPTDMRVISGIIWNRLFNNMNLQIDATLQYAKANEPGKVASSGTWWGAVVPKDKYISSPYNTYEHAGLPPGPIANPSLAAVLAALNPVKTSCLFYFHDSHGVFHCSNTYAEHVALLKKYYGQGK
jgi:uncharacterized YceG family protein